MKVTIFVLVLVLVSQSVCGNQTGSKTVQVDWSTIAGEAEQNKKDILRFLNQSRVSDQYKKLYDCLLEKLTGDGVRRMDVPFSVDGEYDSSKSTRRIVGGRNTSIEAVPWQLSLREKNFPICGGSVVTDTWLLTAAHCILRARSTELTVRVGSSWKTHGGEMYDVRNSYVHPKYVSKTKVNDVGLVRLYTPLRFSATVLPIRIVGRETKLRAHQPTIVSGWGKLKEGGISATYLQSSTLVTIAMKLCRRSGLERKAIDPASMFCAGSFKQGSPDACQGDSGGPIVSDGVLIGVVSWGLGCARGNFPGVYTRLAHPVIWDWVHDHITQKEDNHTRDV